METRVQKGQAQEDSFTGAIERKTAQVPSTVFLGLAVGAMAVSLIFKIAKKEHLALFIGQWAAPFLIMGNYNKMVKQHGSDAADRFSASTAA